MHLQTESFPAWLLIGCLLLSSWGAVNSQNSLDDFHGHTDAGDNSLLWFDGDEPENLSSWEWQTHGAEGRTWHWDGENGTSWTTWMWESTGPDDNHGGGFLLSSPTPAETAGNLKSEAQSDDAGCSPCGGTAWALNGPVLTWTSPPDSSNFFNFSSWMMQQGNNCWGFTSKIPGWGFSFENFTITGDKGGPGDGACAFPPLPAGHPALHGHAVGLGGVGFRTFGFRGLGLGGPFGGLGWGHFPGLIGVGAVSGCPLTGVIARRRRDAETFDDTTEDVDGNPDPGSKPTWAIKRWLLKARDFLMSIAQASHEDEGKGGWSIPLGNGYIQVGPNLLRKVSGWISGAVLSVLGGSPVDPETQVAIETILLDPEVAEAIRNATEQSDSSADPS